MVQQGLSSILRKLGGRMWTHIRSFQCKQKLLLNNFQVNEDSKILELMDQNNANR